MLVDFTPLKYNNVYNYPNEAHALGICVALISMLCIPIVLFYKMFKARGTFREVRNILFTYLFLSNSI